MVQGGQDVIKLVLEKAGMGLGEANRNGSRNPGRGPKAQ